MRSFKSIVILTGAGISAESGIRTFRDSNGLWENHRIEDVASPEGFKRNPKLVHDFYNARRRQLLDPAVQPNAAHKALAQLEEEWEGSFLLVSQNVDDLHRRAGSRSLMNMHGQLKKIKCEDCGASFEWEKDLSTDQPCPGCNSKAMRPDIVWFGESPYYMDAIISALETCDLFVSIGTSGKVYPAAGFAKVALLAYKIEVNLTASDVSDDFDEHYIGPAGVEVPKLVEKLLRKS